MTTEVIEEFIVDGECKDVALAFNMSAIKNSKTAIFSQYDLSALDAANLKQFLVLTGEPGSGKSAFVNYLTLCLAGENLKSEHVNLQTLTAPLPDDQGNPQTAVSMAMGMLKPEMCEIRQTWEHGGLIPVRIILRDFSASAHFPAEQEKGDVCHLMNFLHTQLERTDCQRYAEILQQRLRDGKVLVMFDGLDEVPQAGDRRKRLVECIEGFAKSYADCRLLVTCRPYAYRDPQWHISRFAVSHLAPFTDGQIIRFIQRWYASLGTLEPDTAIAQGTKLQTAVLQRSSLHDLAKRPLLLSLIAYLHAYRHELPERRADLYERLLELLVNKWEKARFDAKDCDDARKLSQHSLAEFLQVGQDVIHRVLKRLAFRAHALQDAQQHGTADISADDLILALVKEARSGGKKVDEWEVCEYLRDRVGILYQRGGSNEMDAVYTFPHRSFQEYLAAAYFQLETDELFKGHEDCQSWQEVAAQLAMFDPDRWREVVLLAGGIDALDKPRPVWDLVNALYPEALNCLTKEAAWGLRLAAEIMVDNLNMTQVGRTHKPIFDRIRTALPQVLITQHLPVVERAAIGRYLAVIGDPRPEVVNVDNMKFCYISKGNYYLGRGNCSDGNELPPGDYQGNYDLSYEYWIAQYPVTWTQFMQFVQETDYEWWGQRKENIIANAPVAYVSQIDAMYFCDWLTKRWSLQGLLPDGLRVSLPNHPEWEKAWVGGELIPAQPLLRSAIDGFIVDQLPEECRNPYPMRCYPWGNEVQVDNANIANNVGSKSSVGIFPQGASPYGCCELVGNVWEWLRTELPNKFPYPPVGHPEWYVWEHNVPATNCSLGGCSFNTTYDYVGYRTYRISVLTAQADEFGFRCCVVPFSTSEASGR